MLLMNGHRYFYHVTPKINLPSIQNTGIDPQKISCHSEHHSEWEPYHVMRYCPVNCLHDYDQQLKARESPPPPEPTDSAPFYEDVQTEEVQTVVFRTYVKTFLMHPFGLDHSHMAVIDEVDDLIKRSPVPHLVADDFIKLFKNSNSISCYEIIDPTELEVCLTPSLFIDSRDDSLFQPLGSLIF